MQQGAGAPASSGPNTNAGMPNTTGANGQEANLSPDAVKQAQQQLKSEGLYKGAIDGRVGPQTRDAVRKFQQQSGLAASSTLDQETLQRLMKNHHG
jgi:membrane-bound lytic murein transglycosylase B